MPVRLQPVYASINRPLTIGGADRRIFFVAVVVGGASFTLFGSLLGGLLMFIATWPPDGPPSAIPSCCGSSCDPPPPAPDTTPAKSRTSP